MAQPKSNQWVGVDHTVWVHLLNYPSVTSSVDKKQNEKGDDVNNNGKRKVMLDYYGKCKYKM